MRKSRENKTSLCLFDFNKAFFTSIFVKPKQTNNQFEWLHQPALFLLLWSFGLEEFGPTDQFTTVHYGNLLNQ